MTNKIYLVITDRTGKPLEVTSAHLNREHAQHRVNGHYAWAAVCNPDIGFYIKEINLEGLPTTKQLEGKLKGQAAHIQDLERRVVSQRKAIKDQQSYIRYLPGKEIE